MRRKKRGKNQVFTVTLPKLAVCVCARACVCVCVYVRTCFLKNLYLLFSEAHIIFGNGIKHKKHEKCLFSLSAHSFIHFPDSRGAFSSPERAPSPLQLPNWTKGGWETKEEPMGCFRWGGILLSSPQLLASASLLSNAIPASLSLAHTHKHTHSHRRAHVEEFWLQSRVPMGERGKGPKPLETLTMVGFPKWGYVPYVCTH